VKSVKDGDVLCSVELTRLYLIKKFGEYYEKSQPYIPKDLEAREWAYVAMKNFPEFVMVRHIALSHPDELKEFLVENIPAHVYYSSAYYSNPSAEMDKKGWLGADLIFDIDSDHLPRKSLKSAKKEVFKLIEILTNDFGIDEKDIEVTFSGNRGYHVHVYDERFTQLESAERREIVDYLTLRGFKLKGSRLKDVSRCVARLLVTAFKKGKIDQLLEALGDRKERVKEILKTHLKEIEEGNILLIPDAIRDKLLELCCNKVAVHVDAPVTADVKRLIRLPNSLHGKTGFKVTVVPLNRLEEFNPLVDAVVFDDEPVKVRILKKVKVEIMGEKFMLDKGKAVVPEYLAVFLMCRGVALYGH